MAQEDLDMSTVYAVGRILSVAMFLAATPFAPASFANELWLAPTSQNDLGGIGTSILSIWPTTVVGAARFAWAVPGDLQSFTAAKVVLIPQAPAMSSTLNVYVCGGETTSLAGASCTGPSVLPFNGTADELVEVDVSVAIAPHIGPSGARYIAVLAFTTPSTVTDRVLGLRFDYEPAPNPGNATLGPNTFTGTQTAPAFVGDGSGLTNVPVPAGIPTLGDNIFTGIQTAPEFIGGGGGLMNVDAARLGGLPSALFVKRDGGNVLFGTQSLLNGNLIVDTSTVTSGVMFKNGTRFLHNFGFSGLNTFLGLNAGNLALTGGGNTAVGGFALNRSTIGVNNTAHGYRALFANTSGGFNTAIGEGALFSNTTGAGNTAIGQGALQDSVDGGGNTAVGVQALSNNTDGDGNTAVGENALALNTSGFGNTAVGTGAGLRNTSGSGNIYLGQSVLGVDGESTTMYLGQVEIQNRTFIAGVRGITPARSDALPVVIDSAGQLGTAAAVPSGRFAICKSNSATAPSCGCSSTVASIHIANGESCQAGPIAPGVPGCTAVSVGPPSIPTSGICCVCQ
jgi:hypothetical protein